MTKLTRSEQHIAENTVCVLLVQGMTPDGETLYAYVAVRADKMQAFMQAQQQPGFDPQQYGVILESGTGEPAPEVRRKMEEEYGFDHTNMVFLSDEGEGDAP